MSVRKIMMIIMTAMIMVMMLMIMIGMMVMMLMIMIEMMLMVLVKIIMLIFHNRLLEKKKRTTVYIFQIFIFKQIPRIITVTNPAQWKPGYPP